MDAEFIRQLLFKVSTLGTPKPDDISDDDVIDQANGNVERNIANLNELVASIPPHTAELIEYYTHGNADDITIRLHFRSVYNPDIRQDITINGYDMIHKLFMTNWNISRMKRNH